MKKTISKITTFVFLVGSIFIGCDMPVQKAEKIEVNITEGAEDIWSFSKKQNNNYLIIN